MVKRVDGAMRRVSNLDSIWWRDIVDICGDRCEGLWFDNNITWYEA